MKKILITFLFFIGLPAVADISFKVEPGNKTVQANGIAEITIYAEWPQGTNAYMIFPPSMPQLDGLEITDHITFGQSLSINSQIVQRIVHFYKFTVTNGGIADTGPIFIDYKTSGSEEKLHRKLSGINFEVKRFEKLKYIIGGGMILAVLALSATFLIVKLTAKKKIVRESSSLEDEMLSQIDKIKKYRLEGDVKKYFQELSDILKDYFRKKYQIGSLADFDPEKISKAGPDKYTIDAAKDLLKLAHNVCYADYLPNSQEQGRIMNFVKKLLEKNRPHQTSAEEELYLK